MVRIQDYWWNSYFHLWSFLAIAYCYSNSKNSHTIVIVEQLYYGNSRIAILLYDLIRMVAGGSGSLAYQN